MSFENGPTVTLRISLNHHPAMMTVKVPSILSEGGVLPPGNGDDEQHHRPRWVNGVLMQLGCVNLFFFSQRLALRLGAQLGLDTYPNSTLIFLSDTQT